MIERKKGIINNIIYDNTTYHSGDYRIYPTLSELKILIEKICDSKATTEYIRITPFYMNDKLNQQIEFDDYIFYLECREKLDEDVFKKHIGLNFGKHYNELTNEEIRIGKLLLPLCENNDIETYRKSLETYVNFLYELIPKLFEISLLKMELKDNDIAFGHFCFEVHSC